jgi:hypothetical protein
MPPCAMSPRAPLPSLPDLPPCPSPRCLPPRPRPLSSVMTASGERRPSAAAPALMVYHILGVRRHLVGLVKG